jgi:hypothetical protein
MVVLAQKERARVSNHFHLCLSHLASVTRNPHVRAHVEVVCTPHRPEAALRPGEVVAKNSHGRSLQRPMSDPFLITAGHSGSDYASVIAT